MADKAVPQNRFKVGVRYEYVPEMKANECIIDCDINGVHLVISDAALNKDVAFKKAVAKAKERLLQFFEDELNACDIEA